MIAELVSETLRYVHLDITVKVKASEILGRNECEWRDHRHDISDDRCKRRRLEQLTPLCESVRVAVRVGIRIFMSRG